jgi:hypothetical protein
MQNPAVYFQANACDFRDFPENDKDQQEEESGNGQKGSVGEGGFSQANNHDGEYQERAQREKVQNESHHKAGRSGFEGVFQVFIEDIHIREGSHPGREKVGTVTRAQVEEIAKTKQEDLNARDMDAAVNIIAGTARSMGIEVVNE